MVPEDGDSPSKVSPRPPSSAEEAFAATVAPMPASVAPADAAASSAPTPPRKLPAGTADGSEATIAAAVLGGLPPLPEVSDALYKKDKEIARGGMGRIVAADDAGWAARSRSRSCSIPSGEQLARFQREALITARLQHPAIVPVHEAGRWPTASRST